MIYSSMRVHDPDEVIVSITFQSCVRDWLSLREMILGKFPEETRGKWPMGPFLALLDKQINTMTKVIGSESAREDDAK